MAGFNLKRVHGYWHPKYLGSGATRDVVLIGRYAIKIPKSGCGWRPFLNGLLANLQERNFAQTQWPELCPIVFSLHGGWLVVMRRAMPLSDNEWCNFDPVGFCEKTDYRVPAEYKRDSFGKINNRVVAIDYG